MNSRIKRQLVLDAVTMALLRRKPHPGLIFHSDRGSQYAADDTEKLLVANGITPSMSGRGNCYDNAVSESFFGRLKEELGDSFPSRKQANADVFEYIEVFYNRRRRHSYNGNLSPLECEQFYELHGRRPAGILDLMASRSMGACSSLREREARSTCKGLFPSQACRYILGQEVEYRSFLTCPPKRGTSKIPVPS